MRKILMLPLIALMALIASCSTDDDGGVMPEPVIPVTSVDYYGVAKVAEIELPVRCTVVYNTSAKLCDIKVSGLKFADAMPAVNIRLAGILCSASASEIEFAMNNLTGVIKDKTMEVTATMAMGEFSFKGTVVPVFSGLMKVLADGTDQLFTLPNTNCEVETSLDGSSANLYIFGAKFAATMPVTVDVKLENIACTVFDGGYSFIASDTIVPFVRMGGEYVPMEAYKFYKIKGEVLDRGTLVFDASMTKGAFEYEGTRFIKTN